MTAKLLRLAYVCEFLLAVVAIFTAWSEIGGQAALDVMHWGWKFGFGATLALAIVALTAAIVADDAWFTMRSMRWLAAILVILVGMGTVTYYYSQEADSTESDDSSTISFSEVRQSIGDAESVWQEKRRDESRRGRHECPRHETSEAS